MYNNIFIEKESVRKYRKLQHFDYNVSPKIFDLLKRIFLASQKSIDIKYQDCNKNLRKVFIDFSKDANNVDKSKFIEDVKKMHNQFKFKINVNNNIITIYVLFANHEYVNTISIILHALNTFCYLFPFNYDGLNIYVCLDDNKRNLEKVHKFKNLDEKFEYLKINSLAMNVSGITNRKGKTIILTRIEEIIKLMYHELIHYVELDEKLINQPVNFSEAYTEFLSVILCSAYESLFINTNVYKNFKKNMLMEMSYSCFLSSNIIKFYKYDINNFDDFFSENKLKDYAPIALWEYIILRTQLMLNLNSVIELMSKTFWRVTDKNKNELIKLMTIDSNLKERVKYYLYDNHIDNSLCYKLLNFNWNKINF